MERDKIIEIKHLSTAFQTEDKQLVRILNDVNLDLYRGEFFGVVGESGSGKSVTAKSIMRLLPDPPAKVLEGEIRYHGRDLLTLSEKEMRDIRGNDISMVFQEPMTALNPVYTCGEQIIESITLHRKVSRAAARKIAVEMFRKVGIPLPEMRVKNYPHEMSGGMRQRVVIAMALCCDPEVLIADEPTTALDTTVQAQVLELIKSIQQQSNMTIFYITHDLAVVAAVCDRVAVMYGGRIVEIAGVNELFHNAMHPYTRGLLQAMPRINESRARLYNIKGNVPNFTRMPKGCPFCSRCDCATERCEREAPGETEVAPMHRVSCWRVMERAGTKEAR